MENTSTIRKLNNGDIEVSASMVEHLLQRVVELSKEGWVILQGTTLSMRLVNKVCMTQNEGVQEPVEEKVEVTIKEVEKAPEEAVKGLDMDLIKSFVHDKQKLEDYGKTFGIDLKKNKSFKNMLADLKKHVGQ